ncbi:MAG: pyridoxal-dependent decarboxylase [Actinomycetota bacterium]
MKPTDPRPALDEAVARSLSWLDRADDRPVGPPVDAEALLAATPVDRLPDAGIAPAEAVAELAAWLDPGLSALGSGRYLALVNGGTLPAALAADWMVSAWDQHAAFAQHGPAPTAAEHVAGAWLLDLLDLPPTAAVGFPTGAQGANTIALLAARHHVAATHGVDIEAAGVAGAPAITVVGSVEQHSSIARSVRLIGLGTDAIIAVDADGTGAMRADAARDAILGTDGPLIVCAQAGNVNAGAFDPLAEIADLVDERRARLDDVWLHIDGAFGLWVRASRRRRHLAEGAERADSWACDAHKWLNTPYDCGISIVADPAVLARAVGVRAAYLPPEGGVADASDRVMEFSRRARGVPVWAALRSLGRAGVEALVDDACDRAADLADAVGGLEGIAVRGQQINQVVVEAVDRDGRPHADRTTAVLAAVVADGRCYPSTTVWQGRPGIRLSVSNWRTDTDDVAAVAAAFADALDAVSD